MLFLHLREFVENDLLKMQPLKTCNIIEACNNSASVVKPATAAAADLEVQQQQQLLARVRVPAALNGVVALQLAEIAQYEE